MCATAETGCLTCDLQEPKQDPPLYSKVPQALSTQQGREQMIETLAEQISNCRQHPILSNLQPKHGIALDGGQVSFLFW